jgi:transposase
VLARWASDRSSASARARRARVVLELARGGSLREVGARTSLHPETVARWRRRFEANGVQGLASDAPRVRGERAAMPALVERIVRTTLGVPPPTGRRWTTRSLARALHVNHMIVHRVWRSRGISFATVPGRWDAGPESEEPKVEGVFLGGPNAVAISLPRSEPLATNPAMPEPAAGSIATVSGAHRLRPETRTALGFLAVLDRVQDSGVALAVAPARAPQELLVFLRSLTDRVPRDAAVHVFFDRSWSEPTGRVGAWFASHPNVLAHVPVGRETWTDTVERWLRGRPHSSFTGNQLEIAASFNQAIAHAFEAHVARNSRSSGRSD